MGAFHVWGNAQELVSLQRQDQQTFSITAYAARKEPCRGLAIVSPGARSAFSIDTAKLAHTDPDICFHAIVADKRNVKEHIRKDSKVI